jgi:hypothetical protein
MAGLFFCALLMPALGLPRGPAASRNYRLRTFGASGTRFIGLLTQLSRVLQEHPRHPPKSFYRMRHGQSLTPHSRLLQRGCATINESGGAVHFGEPVVVKRSKEDHDQRQHARLSATPPAERRFTKCCCRWLAALSVAAEHVQRPRSSDRTTHIGTIRKTRHRAHVWQQMAGRKAPGRRVLRRCSCRSILRPTGGLGCCLCLNTEFRVPWCGPGTADGTREVVLQARRAVGCALDAEAIAQMGVAVGPR